MRDLIPASVLAVLEELWPYLVGVLTVVANVLASGHAVLRKRDVRAAVSWVGLVWLVPLLGVTLYVLLGVNRIRRRPKALQPGQEPHSTLRSPHRCLPPELPLRMPEATHLRTLARLTEEVVRHKPLLAGNRVVPLDGGQAAYGAMLEAIEGARTSVSLCSYIFDNDPVGWRFAEALGRAVARGVQVRVLIDAVGVRYTFPTVSARLRRAGVPAALFLRSLVTPKRLPFLNLRNHRKIMVVDGRLGFTGGMNIRADFLPERGEPRARDLHFRVEGPVVAHLQETFAEDWAFTTREVLTGELWFPPLEPAGPVLARGIADGPDENLETTRWVLLGALATARVAVRIVTPYFLPDAALNTALAVAARRGIRVDIVLPGKGNLPVVEWASRAQLWQVIQPGCRVYFSPPPFDHTKLLVVDRVWALIGSTNWDARSLRLNFEFDVECYEPQLAEQLDALIDARIAASRRVSLEEMDARSLPVRLRDGLARLLSPYL